MNIVKFTCSFLKITAIVSMIYFFIIIWASGIKTSFLWFFLAVPILCGIAVVLLNKLYITSGTPRNIAIIITIFIWIAVILFTAVEGFLIANSKMKPDKNADYIIILGASVRGDIPSKTLYSRINAAYDYLIDNPNTIAICSGGQGDNENISEAAAIARELASMGIEDDRLIIEDNSTNTVENLIFSSKFIKGYSSDAKVLVVTSDFHIYRACMLAKRHGYKNISGLSADEILYTTPAYYIREFFALIKDIIIK